MLPDEPITVITLTRHRRELLERAITSVRAQDYAGVVEHMIGIDDDPESQAWLETQVGNDRRVLRGYLASRSEEESRMLLQDRRFAYPRMARLLNIGIAHASSPWLGFLDDDNEFEPHHLSSLIECARESGSRAVHSARRVYRSDGSPYLDELFPGAADEAEGARIYKLMCDRGVWVRGTNILQDRVDPN